MESAANYEADLNLTATELRLGLPGTVSDEKPAPPPPPAGRSGKRTLAESAADDCGSKSGSSTTTESDVQDVAPVSKAQVVGWPPVRSYRKNSLEQVKKTAEAAEMSGMYVKVSMDGAPYLRKIDLNMYKGYSELLKALEGMFKSFTTGDYSEREGYKGSEYVSTYEDKDGDWMLVGDVPWE
ncbi:Auxin-induced protein 22D [Asimina triloba]